jgi:ribonuclease BN (tRNA processing enzyme)
MGSISVTVLGAGDAFASRGRFQAGYLISGERGNVLVDAGPTLLASMKRTGAAPADIDTVLISHLHGDHFAGLAFLILEYLYESPRHRSLTIAGPRGLEQRTWAMFHAMYREIDPARVAKRIKFAVLEPHHKARVDGMVVESIRTPHTRRDVSLAFRIGMNGRTIAYSGDTGWTDELVEISAGADLFLCECTYYESAELTFHLNYPLIARNQERFTPGRMILTHIGREVLEHSAEVRHEMATDGMMIRV